MTQIRVLGPEDAPIYRELRLQALTHDPTAFLTDAASFEKVPLDTVREQLKDVPEGKFTLGAFLDGELVGMATFLREERVKIRHKGMVVAVYVLPAARGQGVARQLMETLIQRIRTYPNLEQVQLTVALTQEPARKLYDRLGFEVYGLEKRAVKEGNTYIDDEHRVLFLR